MSSSNSVEVSDTPSPAPSSIGNNAPKYGTLVPNRVFVGGISANTTEQDLLELFSRYGSVKATKVINDRAGVSKGYGFVTFETEEEARRLTQEADNIMLKDRKLNIAPAIKKQVNDIGYLKPYSPSLLDGTNSVVGTTGIFFGNGATYAYSNSVPIIASPGDYQAATYAAHQVHQTAAEATQISSNASISAPSTAAAFLYPQPVYLPQYQQYPAAVQPQWAAAPQWRWVMPAYPQPDCSPKQGEDIYATSEKNKKPIVSPKNRAFPSALNHHHYYHHHLVPSVSSHHVQCSPCVNHNFKCSSPSFSSVPSRASPSRVINSTKYSPTKSTSRGPVLSCYSDSVPVLKPLLDESSNNAWDELGNNHASDGLDTRTSNEDNHGVGGQQSSSHMNIKLQTKKLAGSPRGKGTQHYKNKSGTNISQLNVQQKTNGTPLIGWVWPQQVTWCPRHSSCLSPANMAAKLIPWNFPQTPTSVAVSTSAPTLTTTTTNLQKSYSPPVVSPAMSLAPSFQSIGKTHSPSQSTYLSPQRQDYTQNSTSFQAKSNFPLNGSVRTGSPYVPVTPHHANQVAGNQAYGGLIHAPQGPLAVMVPYFQCGPVMPPWCQWNNQPSMIMQCPQVPPSPLYCSSPPVTTVPYSPSTPSFQMNTFQPNIPYIRCHGESPSIQIPSQKKCNSPSRRKACGNGNNNTNSNGSCYHNWPSHHDTPHNSQSSVSPDHHQLPIRYLGLLGDGVRINSFTQLPEDRYALLPISPPPTPLDGDGQMKATDCEVSLSVGDKISF